LSMATQKDGPSGSAQAGLRHEQGRMGVGVKRDRHRLSSTHRRARDWRNQLGPSEERSLRSRDRNSLRALIARLAEEISGGATSLPRE
jgi:hypothetical protein